MPFEETEFKFPDEIESKEEKKDIEIEIEVEEDAPEEDRNVNPLPENLREDLYKDELEDYSAKVKKKLMQMKKLAHDERREKEQARREQEEAISLAQRVLEENKRLKELAVETEKSAISSVAKTIDMEISEADRAFREAYESGETDKILEAQKKLWDLTLKKEKVSNYKPALQEESIPVQRQTQDTPRVDPKAADWQRNNSWFGEDKLMTALALATHEQLKEEGVALSSQEYYRRIDQTMRQRFPEKFETDKKADPEKRVSRVSNVVAPASRSTAPKKISLKASQVALAKKLGLTPEQYARELIKMES